MLNKLKRITLLHKNECRCDCLCLPFYIYIYIWTYSIYINKQIRGMQFIIHFQYIFVINVSYQSLRQQPATVNTTMSDEATPAENTTPPKADSSSSSCVCLHLRQQIAPECHRCRELHQWQASGWTVFMHRTKVSKFPLFFLCVKKNK